MAHNFEVIGRLEIMAKTAPPPAVDTDFPTRKKKSNAGGADAEITKLVQSVFFPSAIPVSQAIGFCGVDSGASSSWVCARAGEALAEQLSGSVCLVDANFRHPSLHRQFGIENRLGFADAVRDSKPMERLAGRRACVEFRASRPQPFRGLEASVAQNEQREEVAAGAILGRPEPWRLLGHYKTE